MTSALDYILALPEVPVGLLKHEPMVGHVQNVVVATSMLIERCPEAAVVTTPALASLASGSSEWCVVDMSEVEARHSLFKPQTGIRLAAVTIGTMSDAIVQVGMFMPCWSSSGRQDHRVGALVVFNSYGKPRTYSVYSDRYTKASAKGRGRLWLPLVRELLGLFVSEEWVPHQDWELKISETGIVAVGFPAAQETIQQALALLPSHIEAYR